MTTVQTERTIIAPFSDWMRNGRPAGIGSALYSTSSARSQIKHWHSSGVCYAIAAHYCPGTDVVVPILAFSGLAIPMHRLFALITGRLRRDIEVRTRPVEA